MDPRDPAGVNEPTQVPSTTEALAASIEQPQAGTPTTTTEATAPAPTPSTVEITPEIQKLIDEAATKASRDANREAVAAKKIAADLQTAEQARKDAALSDTERLAKERDDALKRAETATAAARTATVNAAILAEAGSFADPTDALSIAATITVDDDGKPVGVQEAIAALLASKPHYAKALGTPQLDPTNGARGTGAPKVSDTERLAQLRNPGRPADIWRR